MTDAVGGILLNLSGSTAVVAIIIFVFWKADDLISKSGRELLEKLINETIDDPGKSELRKELIEFLKHYFSLRLPAHKFIVNVALLTSASVAILVCIYMMRTSGFFTQLSSDTYARQLFFTQLIFNGLVVTYIINHIAFSFYSPVIERVDTLATMGSIIVVVGDVLLKIVLFAVVTAASYIAFASYGSFGGSMTAAVHAVLPTIISGLHFENLTGGYLYAVAFSSLPIFLICLINLLIANPTMSGLVRRLFFWLPFEGKPMRSLAVVLGLFATVFYQISNSALALA